MRVKLWRDVPLMLLAVAFLSALLFPVFEEVKIGSPSSRCLSNVKQSSLGLLMYSGDENDRFPFRDAWMDATLPYVKREDCWHCSEVPKASYGYAYNGALSGAQETKLTEPPTTALVYDSVNPIRNASDLRTSLPLPGRHGRKEGQGPGKNNVGYADGHAKSVPGVAAK